MENRNTTGMATPYELHGNGIPLESLSPDDIAALAKFSGGTYQQEAETHEIHFDTSEEPSGSKIVFSKNTIDLHEPDREPTPLSGHLAIPFDSPGACVLFVAEDAAEVIRIQNGQITREPCDPHT